MHRPILLIAAAALLTRPALGQSLPPRPPVIDMHVHSTTTAPSALPRLDSLNVRYFVLASLAPDLRAWAAVDTARFATVLVFPCDRGRAPYTGRQCFGGGAGGDSAAFPDTAWLRSELRARRIRALGELEQQYVGMSLNDPRMEPYWRLAEEFDVPVGVHVGTAPPGVAYAEGPLPFKSPQYRMALGDPLVLEDVLLRHQKLRLYVMHAGWPRLENTLALLAMHPGVYVDIAGLSSEQVLPRAAYYQHLRALVDAGFGKRIMFGSDFPNQVEPGIDAILAADFLSATQKSDILCGNASRFLRLPASVCR